MGFGAPDATGGSVVIGAHAAQRCQEHALDTPLHQDTPATPSRSRPRIARRRHCSDHLRGSTACP